MNQRTIILSLILLTLCLAGCRKPPTMPTQAFTEKGVSMKLDPPAGPDCKPSATYRAVLSWTIDAQDPPKTDVRIDAIDGQLFARSNDQKAHAETGNWVRPGMWFLLFDRRTGEMLGALQAGPKPCP